MHIALIKTVIIVVTHVLRKLEFIVDKTCFENSVDPDQLASGEFEMNVAYSTEQVIARSSRACSFGSQTMREFSEPVSRNRLGQGHR